MNNVLLKNFHVDPSSPSNTIEMENNICYPFTSANQCIMHDEDILATLKSYEMGIIPNATLKKRQWAINKFTNC